MRYISVLLLLCSLQAAAQGLSNKGKEFWVGYGHHQFMEPGLTNSQDMVIYLSAEEPATVTVSIYGTAWTRTYNIPANTVVVTETIPKAGVYDARLYSVPPSYGGNGGEQVFSNKAIHIESNVPIVAYAHIYGSQSSGATMLMPVATWGYTYTSLNSQQKFDDNCFSWMYVIAKENNTVVEITPSRPTRTGHAANVPFTVTLAKGEIYQLIGASLGNKEGEELTGSLVHSIGNAAGQCFPVAVFSGSSRTYIGCAGYTPASGDNNIQQVFPYQAWGKHYLTAPLSGRTATSFQTNIFKVLVKDPATVVKRNGVVLTGLKVNRTYQFESNTADYIEADQPVMLAQFMGSVNACPTTTGIGDPEMIYLSPVEQSIKRVAFYRNTQENITINHLTLVVPDAGLNSLLIDGANTYNTSYAHPNMPGYTVVVKTWTGARAQCAVTCDSGFTAVTYGLGDYESYGYNAGTFINNLNAIGEIHNTYDTSKAVNEFTCTNTPVNLSVLLTYQPTKLVWQLSKTGGTDVTDNSPVADSQQVINGVTYYHYTLSTVTQFPAAGVYDITVLSTAPHIDNCNNTEEVNFTVTVKGRPYALPSMTRVSDCVLDTIHLTGEDVSNGFTLSRWLWTLPGGVKDSGKAISYLPATGNQVVGLQVISQEGCVGDTTFTIQSFDKPIANYTSDLAAICEGSTVTFTDQSAYGGISALPLHDTIISFDTAGMYPVKLVAKVSEACVSDTLTANVQVFDTPVPSFTYPASCIAAGAAVQFTNTATTTDNQTQTAYAWDFGDGSTATDENPAHSYTYYGSYNIRHRVTTSNGCTADTVVTAIFNLKPALTYAAIPAVCESAKTPNTIALAGVMNGVTGSGVYRGPATDTAGNFTPAIAGAGTHTIWYVFTSDGGCIDSVSATVTVNPAPRTVFTVDGDVCLGLPVTVSDQSTGNIVSWSWLLGDGSTLTGNTTFSHTYTAAGTYDVKLLAVSDLGCTSDTGMVTTHVYPLPVAGFKMPKGVCMPDGAVAFTNTTVNGQSYAWNFGDGGVSTDASPSHTYTAKGNYTIRLQATSAYGCEDDTTQQFRSFYDKPIAAFTVSPDTLCQGTDNAFTDKSTAVNSTISAWAWDFGDGSTSSTRNPVKRYTDPGDYPVQLVVTSSAGCIADPATSTVKVYLQPLVDAGPSYTVAQGTPLVLEATANNETSLSFLWTPSGGLSAADVLQPSLTATEDIQYTLTATGEGGCTASDDVDIKVLKPVKAPNAFSPNGDHINDTWVITNLSDYAGCTVEVFNRYGQLVYQSTGYSHPWDGTYNGQPLPLATYYYVIRLKNGFAPMTGYVVILK